MHVFTTSEIAAALFQTAITFGLAGVFLFLYSRYRKMHFLWWAATWALYGLRLVAIIAFLGTSSWAWLYWHQVITGWTALALLGSALAFSHRLPWRRWYALLLVFPAVWSYIAIFRLDNFLLAAGPAVAFLSITTLWTGFEFWRYRRQSGSSAAAFLAVTLFLWGLHHLDYPLLRARGAWNPWGYYLDALFLLAMGAGVILLVIEELHQGLWTLSALSGDLRRTDQAEGLRDLLLRPLALRGVRGSAAYQPGTGGITLVQGVGACSAWTGDRLPARVRSLIERTMASGRPGLQGQAGAGEGEPRFAAAIPLGSTGLPGGVLLVVSELAAQFTALDDGILAAVGAQIGAAIENSALYSRLAQRTGDLERLSVRMIQQHEEHRQGLARELHDETAQVFSALKLQVGSLRESAAPELGARFDKLVNLVDRGSQSIRNVTDALRPAVLDDLGIIPALRALIADFKEWSGVEVEFRFPEQAPPLTPPGELALFRAVQEGLSNVARHSHASQASVVIDGNEAGLRLVVHDNGEGHPTGQLPRLDGGPGRSGLFGMRERITALGGRVTVGSQPGEGFRLTVELPLPSRAES